MSVKSGPSLLLAITSLLCLTDVSDSSAAFPLNYSQRDHQHSLISSRLPRGPSQGLPNQGAGRSDASATSLSRLVRQTQQVIGGKITTTTDVSKSAEDSLELMMDDKYLDLYANSQQIDANQIDGPPTQDETPEKRGPFDTVKASLGKTRRQMEQQSKTVDWWTKFVHDSKIKKAQLDSKIARQQPAKEKKAVIYREQPLNQNALLTIRHQLMAIRDKHRMLMFKSVPQLMQLDQKLVDSYKLCLKRDMPLYAGMLYRTRDYVVRMANEIKHERQVLEAMAKQIQKVLRTKSTNSTLVKDYNRHLTTLNSFPSPPPASQAAHELEQVAQQHQFDPRDEFAADSKSIKGGKEEMTKKSLGDASKPPSETSDDQNVITFGKASFHRAAAKESRNEWDDELSRSDENQVPSIQRQNLISNNIEQTNSYSTKQRPKSKKFSKKTTFSEHDGQQQTLDSEVSTLPSASKKQRQKFYNVNINEVNLKKELTKTQALIDRINSSSHELMSVADDIMYLFKLSSGDLSYKKGLSGKANKFDKLHGSNGFMDLGAMDNKRAKKMMLKSPFKLYFERYGKLTMSSLAPSTSTSVTPDNDSQWKSTTTGNMVASSPFMNIDSNNAPEIKPLFDPNFVVYKDPVDIDLGFDSPAMLDI